MVYGVLLTVAGVLLSDGVTPYLVRGWRLLVRLVGGRLGEASRRRAPCPGPRRGRATCLGRRPCPGRRRGGGARRAGLGAEPACSVVTSVSKSFGGNAALTDVSFSAEPAKITALIGPNGSGKTTMLNIISGFYRPTPGRSSWAGGGSRASPARQSEPRRGGPHLSDAADPGLRERGRGDRERPPRHDRDRAGALRLPHAAVPPDRAAGPRPRGIRGERPGLAGQLRREATSLPLGTRRILELARVLTGERSAVLLDEVASGLDEAEIDKLVDAVRLMRDLGATVVLVEHNFELVRAIADKVVVLADGAVLAEGTPDEIAAHPGVVQSYLGERPPTSAVPACASGRTTVSLTGHRSQDRLPRCRGGAQPGRERRAWHRRPRCSAATARARRPPCTRSAGLLPVHGGALSRWTARTSGSVPAARRAAAGLSPRPGGQTGASRQSVDQNLVLGALLGTRISRS